MEIAFVGGIYEAVLSSFDQYKDLIFRLDLCI